MSGKVVLSVTAGSMKGQEFVFEEHDTFLFGRSEYCHVKLPEDPFVSRHHFVLEAAPPQAKLRDLGSLNGTFVNGARIGGKSSGDALPADTKPKPMEVDLAGGDTIQVGETIFAVNVIGEISDMPTAFGSPCGAVQAPQGRPDRESDGKRSTADSFQNKGESPARPDSGAFAGYRVEDEIGAGGMGIVYRAIRLSDGRPVAIKTLKAQGSVTERQREAFMREIDILKTLQHPQISSLLESGTSGGRVFYFVMDYYAGGNLTVLRQNLKTPHPVRASLRVALLALKGLDCAHRRGIVHRDLKPQNILVEKVEGGKPNVRVADFGLAKSFVKAGLSGMTVTGNFGGTLLYMPPEQFSDFKYVKPISDVWSMAATLYHIMTGYPPRQVLEGQDPIRAVLEAPTVPIRERVPSIPATVAEVIDCALSSSLSERYPSATEFRQALKLACRDL